MAIFLFRFWPVLLPLLVYGVWMMYVRRSALKRGDPAPHFREGPWFWAVVTSLVLGIVILLATGLSHGENKGDYVPPHMENGEIVPGRVQP